MKILNETYEIKELNEGGLSRIWQYTHKEGLNFAIIGSQDMDTKEDRSRELHREIDNLASKNKNITYRVLRGRYTYDNGDIGFETSYLINNISRRDALRIANKINQESIIYKDDDFFGFIDCKSGKEDGTLSKSEKNMLFSDKDVQEFSSRLDSKHNKGQEFVFVMEEVRLPKGSNSVKNLGGIKTEINPLFEIHKIMR